MNAQIFPRTKQAARIAFAIREMIETHGYYKLRFLTLTTKEKCTAREVADKWRALQHSRFFRELNIQYVRVLEKHPGGHGWHIHAVISRRLDINAVRKYAKHAGFGSIMKIERLRSNQSGPQIAFYLAKYVSKSLRERTPDEKHVRLVNVSSGLATLKRVHYSSPEVDFVREALKNVHFKTKPYRIMRLLTALYQHVSLANPAPFPVDEYTHTFDTLEDFDNALFFCHCYASDSTCQSNLGMLEYCLKDKACRRNLFKFTSPVLCDIKRKATSHETQSNSISAEPLF